MKIAFFGTAEFSANILAGLIDNDDIDIMFVVSQEDKHIGRKKILQETAVKQLAKAHSIPVYQPHTLKGESEIYKLGKDVDFFVVVAYGKIMPQSLLDVPKKGCINLHGSILPKYRGASPVQESIKNGDSMTGLTTMYMSAGMDEGDMLELEEVIIDKDDTQVDIFKKFERIGAKLVITTLKGITSDTIERKVQDAKEATYCHKISKGDGRVSFVNETTQNIYNKFRAYTPWPGIFSFFKEKKIAILSCYIGDNLVDGNIGECIKLGKKIGIVCADRKVLFIETIKLEGKGSMDILSFINGNPDFIGYEFLDV